MGPRLYALRRVMPTTGTLLGAIALAFFAALIASGQVVFASAAPNGSLHVSEDVPDGGDGSPERPFSTVNEALKVAQPGQVVLVGPGTYSGAVKTVRSGSEASPIVIRGDNARLVSNGRGRLVNINHSHITLEGFDISKADKGIWVQNARGVKILNNTLHDLGGECIRLKYFASSNEIAGNQIGPCGLVNFNLSTGKKNGEGVYIGTAPEQLHMNPTSVPDQSNYNLVHDNRMNVSAECVDIKEAAASNVVDDNVCAGGRDPDGAGFGSRGSGNIFRANRASGGAGAGIRQGGDQPTDGIGNVVESNTLVDNAGYGVKVMRLPQASICGNTVTGNGEGLTTKGALDPTASCAG